MLDSIARNLYSDGSRGLPDGRREARIEWRPTEPDRAWDNFWDYVGAQVRQNIFHPGTVLAEALECMWDEGVKTAEITHINEHEVGLEDEFAGWNFLITWTPVERCPSCGGTECCGAGAY
jgi:hypothetical protein